MYLEIPHQFTKQAAKERVEKALTQARPQMQGHISSTEERWEGDILHFAFDLQGKRIEGTLQVEEKQFIIDAKLPLMWRMFEGRIEKMVGDQIKQLI